MHRFTIEQNFSMIWLVHTCDDLDQGGFARPILSKQRMDLTGPQFERDFVQDLHPGKTLANVLQFKNMFAHLTGVASSSQIVNSMLACRNRPIQSADRWLSVNKQLIRSGRAKDVRSSFPNLDESTRANN